MCTAYSHYLCVLLSIFTTGVYMQVVSPFLTFPTIGWWQRVAAADTVIFDIHENYQKMSGRNRYSIAGPNNAILLSVPLAAGRNQHVPIAEVRISNEQKWQVQHWRTLVSVYNRSPYFYHYEAALKTLFEQDFALLTDFNRATVEWAKRQLNFTYQEQESAGFQKEYPGLIDLRDKQNIPVTTARYHQVFEDRTGYIPGMSILDLLFTEGPHAGAWLRECE
jgi:hypothetical protein